MDNLPEHVSENNINEMFKVMSALKLAKDVKPKDPELYEELVSVLKRTIKTLYEGTEHQEIADLLTQSGLFDFMVSL